MVFSPGKFFGKSLDCVLFGLGKMDWEKCGKLGKIWKILEKGQSMGESICACFQMPLKKQGKACAGLENRQNEKQSKTGEKLFVSELNKGKDLGKANHFAAFVLYQRAG